jgi:three-Cys-motif partner protein
MCASIDREFFNRKRPWSHIKDQVVGKYMPAYLSKLSTRNRTIILVDAFAGPGVYEDPVSGAVSYGSPIIMCQKAEEHAKVSYRAFFGNRDRKHHERLVEELRKLGLPNSKACPVHLESRNLLGEISKYMRDETILLYLDPFGFKGCEFSNLRPFLERPPYYSTEIIMNLNVADLPRMAARHAMQDGRRTPQILDNHRTLTAVLNGEWWKDILWDGSLSTEEGALEVVRQYSNQFRGYFKYTDYCPVRENEKSKLKYVIIFCSNHPDAPTLHNDNMCKAYNDHIVQARWSGTLFEGTRSWLDDVPRDYDALDALIEAKVQKWNSRGIRPKREEVWLEIVTEPGYFMRWTETEYRRRVSKLYNDDFIASDDVRRPGRLNDKCRLYVKMAA